MWKESGFLFTVRTMIFTTVFGSSLASIWPLPRRTTWQRRAANAPVSKKIRRTGKVARYRLSPTRFC